ncbi:type II toxin-antitoxin system YoeB family toxin [Stomatobaculum longum]
MIKAWTEDAWEDFAYWTKQDKKTLKRILQFQIVRCGSHYRDK